MKKNLFITYTVYYSTEKFFMVACKQVRGQQWHDTPDAGMVKDTWPRALSTDPPLPQAKYFQMAQVCLGSRIKKIRLSLGGMAVSSESQSLLLQIYSYINAFYV